jgi:hypothetical protein
MTLIIRHKTDETPGAPINRFFEDWGDFLCWWNGVHEQFVGVVTWKKKSNEMLIVSDFFKDLEASPAGSPEREAYLIREVFGNVATVELSEWSRKHWRFAHHVNSKDIPSETEVCLSVLDDVYKDNFEIYEAELDKFALEPIVKHSDPAAHEGVRKLYPGGDIIIPPAWTPEQIALEEKRCKERCAELELRLMIKKRVDQFKSTKFEDLRRAAPEMIDGHTVTVVFKEDWLKNHIHIAISKLWDKPEVRSFEKYVAYEARGISATSLEKLKRAIEVLKDVKKFPAIKRGTIHQIMLAEKIRAEKFGDNPERYLRDVDENHARYWIGPPRGY